MVQMRWLHADDSEVAVEIVKILTFNKTLFTDFETVKELLFMNGCLLESARFVLSWNI